MDKEQYFLIGKIVAPHGIKGDVSCISLSDVEHRLIRTKTVYLMDPNERIISTVNIKAKPHKGRYIVQIDGIKTRDEAEQLKNCFFAITRSDAILPEGRYFVRDLIGMAVVDQADQVIGTVTDILTDRVQDLYVVKTGEETEFMFPAVSSILLEIDEKDKKIVVDLPDGLIDIYK